jgi:CheY-like chemotaxis protein
MHKRTVRSAIVLLVDDDPGDQELTRRALQEDAMKIDLHVANNGEEAMDYLLHCGEWSDPALSPRPDLVLLDLNMPRVDGRQVLERMRAHEKLKSIPVVVLTTSQQETDIVRSYDLGCNSFIVKPVGMEAFLKTIRELGSYWLELVTLPSEVTT